MGNGDVLGTIVELQREIAALRAQLATAEQRAQQAEAAYKALTSTVPMCNICSYAMEPDGTPCWVCDQIRYKDEALAAELKAEAAAMAMAKALCEVTGKHDCCADREDVEAALALYAKVQRPLDNNSR